MPNTTKPTPTFESIDLAALADIQGGCKKHHCNCSNQQQMVFAPVFQMPAAPTAPATTAAPAEYAPPRPAPEMQASTEVSVGYA